MAIGSNSVAGKITVTGEVVTKGFSDFKAKVDMAVGSATKLATALDQAIDRGGKFVNLMQANTIAIDGARAATAGLVDDFTLLSASNRAAALGIKLTSDEFAQLSKAAVVMSRKLGTDASEAVNDLITGIGRQSMAVLDNLGIIVKAEDAYDRYAESIGKTASELTAVEKRTAFQNEAMRKLAEATQGGADSLNNMADNWQRLKTLITNTTDGLKAWFLQNETIGNRISSFTDMIRFYGAAFRDSTPAIDEHRKAIHKTNIEIGELLHKMGSSDADVLTAVGLAAAASALGEKPIAKTGLRAVKEGKPFAQEAGGRGSSSPLEWNKGVQQAGEMQIATEVGLAAETEALALQLQKLQVADDLRRIREDETINQARQNAMQRESNKLVADAVAKQTDLNQQALGYDGALRSLAEGGLAQFGAGIWGAIDAAVQGKESFGAAMAAMARSVLMSIAASATGEAVLETGRGLAALATTWGVPNPKATLHFAAAGVFAGIGATAGLAGVGLGAAMSGGGGSGGSSAGGAGSGFRTSDRMGGSSSFGDRRERSDPQPIIVEVYMGDKSNRAAAMQLEKQLTARIKKARS